MSPIKQDRLSPRTRVQAQIIFKIPTEKIKDKFLTFTSENLSESGAFLKVSESKLPFKVGTDLDLHFSLPKFPALIRAKAKVIWTTEGWSKDPEGVNGFGIKFVEISDEFRQMIRRFVSENVNG